jgi:hypothetical protein
MAVVTLSLNVASCSLLGHHEPAPPESGPREQLSVGYSLLYQEADGIPKLKWLIRFKDKSDEMARVTHELMSYYTDLAENLKKLSAQFPVVRLNVRTMPEIEADTRKAMGTELARTIAPVVGESGIDFEREALLTFHDSLNEQRHLVRVMLEREKVPALRAFLETTRSQLDSHYASVGTLLDRRYFKHD